MSTKHDRFKEAAGEQKVCSKCGLAMPSLEHSVSPKYKIYRCRACKHVEPVRQPFRYFGDGKETP